MNQVNLPAAPSVSEAKIEPFHFTDALGRAEESDCYSLSRHKCSLGDRGRMSQFTDGGVLTREYAYNARGERVIKRDPTVTGGDISYVYDEAGRLLGEYDEAGVRIKEYVWLDDTLVAVLGSHAGNPLQCVLTAPPSSSITRSSARREWECSIRYGGAAASRR